MASRRIPDLNMTAKTLRAAALALCAGAALTVPGAAGANEQNTADGVAPATPGHSEAVAATEAHPVAEAPPPGSALPMKPAAPVTAPPPLPTGNEAQRYCDNIAAVAAEARFAWQTRKLNDLQGQVTQRIADLEKKQAELEGSLARRDEAMKKAQATLISVYAKMQPDAAAAQLSLLDDGLAAAVLSQLNPRQASAILNEIKPDRASQLVAAMTSLAAPDAKTDGKKS